MEETPARQFDLNNDVPSKPLASNSKEYAAQQLAKIDTIVPVKDEPQLIDMHEARFNAWQLGMTYQEIADAEGFETDMAIRRSVNYMLLRLGGMVEQIQARNNHTIARAHENQGAEYFTTLATLFKEKSWMAKSAALKHFRETVMPTSSSVTVNVDNRKQSIHTGTLSFEAAMNKVRTLHQERAEEEAEQKRIAAPAVIDAVLVEDSEKL